MNGIVIELRRQGFNVLHIPHAGMEFDEILECVKQVEFEDDYINLAIRGNIGSNKNSFQIMNSYLSYSISFLIWGSKLNKLNNIIKSRDKIGLLRWVAIENTPKFDMK